MRNAMEKELKTEQTRGNGKDFALTLMPLYALGVGVFALYKFLKTLTIHAKKSLKTSFSEHPEAEMDEGGDENCGHEVLFDNMVESGEEEHKHGGHEFILSPVEELKKMEIAGATNQDTAKPGVGLRRSIRNE